MKKAKIIGLGSYLPKKVLTNADFEKMIDTSDEWITSRTGIKERRIAADDEFTSDMGYEAAKKAIEDAKLKAEDIDIIFVATLTPDYIFPSTACLIQEKLEAKNAAALDIQAACSGYVYALSLAKALVENNTYKNILIIASEKLSSIINYKDRSTSVLFGDAAAAAVVSQDGSGLEIQSIYLGASGSEADLLILPAGGCKNPASEKTLKEGLHYIKMGGKEVFKHAVRRMQQAIEKCLKETNLSEKDISWLIPHQANERIIDAIAKRFEHLDNEKVYKEVVRKFGNTSASSVGLALDFLKKENKLKSKEKILLTVFGAGFTWGAAILENN
ncbi:MAG: 3-oxoacyl-[acyl-carrier-protein] synthase 3 [Candidatus Anoxychlamydiales bacterium]|nr:3-oxoacyl-[acyl-carrier-protein] synthase 3 [Candidatus Anoxychlamydiales bacterium]